MMNFINFWLQMQVAIKQRKILVFILLCWSVNITDATFEIYVYSNLQNSLAAGVSSLSALLGWWCRHMYVARNTGLSHANSAMFDPASVVRFIWLWPWPVADIDGWGGRCADIHLFRTIFSSPSTSNSLHHYHKLVAVSVLITFINSDAWFLLICN